MQYDLVFEGGGAKGMVFVGAMQVFEQRGHTYNRLLGTSAGAITAALLAAGYTADEMLEALGERENGKSVFSSFIAQPGPFEKAQVLKSVTLQFLTDVDIPFIPDFIERRLDEAIVKWLSTDPKLACSFSFLEFGGLYSADHFVTWLKRRLDTGTDKGKPRQYSTMTLKEFFDATGYDLTLVASDTTGGAMLVLNHRTAPQLPLVWAVRMSMSIPLLWQEVLWLPEWGQYRGRDMTNHAIVDGGMLSNFPIELFVSQNNFVKAMMGDQPGEGVLGMYIDESTQVEGAKAAALKESPSLLSQVPAVRRVSNLLNTTLSARDKMVTENVENLVVRLPAGGYGTTEFEMSDERRSLLVDAGCKAMNDYFEKLDYLANSASFGDVGSLDIVDPGAQADKIALRILEE
jgi:NTE family protein